MIPTSRSKLSALLVSNGLVFALATTGCKKDEEPPPPLPAAAPAATPQAVLELAPEDAGAPDADAEAPKGKGGPGAPRSSLKKCCDALTQNAKSAPPPNDGFMLQAAAVCNSLVATGQDKGAAMGMIRGALKGVALPAGCL